MPAIDHIPKAFREMPAWTISGPTKIPLDPYALFRLNTIKGYSPKTDELMPLEPIAQYLSEMKNPDLRAAFRLTADIPYVIVDIEPKGMVNHNPHFKWPFVYTEFSRNRGLHGILPFQPPFEYTHLKDKFTIKDDLWQSEILVAKGHFCTFTFDELPLADRDDREAYAYSEQFQLKLAKHLDSYATHDPIDTSVGAITPADLDGPFKILIDKQLTTDDLADIDRVKQRITPLTYEPNDDKSKVENAKILQLYGELVRHDPSYLSEQQLSKRAIPVMWALTTWALPERKKHRSKRNSTDYGRVPWLAYWMLRAMTYIRSQSANDSDLASWLTAESQE